MTTPSKFVAIYGLVFWWAVAITAAQEPTERYEKIIHRMVQSINAENYPAIQQDFGKVMLDAFPLEKSKQFFQRLLSQCGKITKLSSPRLVPPNQAVLPAHFEHIVLDIKVVLDDQDKIIGLWFVPHTPEIFLPEKHETVLQLPFSGRWFVVWGGDSKEQNQHHDVPFCTLPAEQYPGEGGRHGEERTGTRPVR